MQLNKALCLFMFLLLSSGNYSQEVKKIDYVFMSRTCDTLYYGIAKDSSRASFGIYGGGYHIKAKRDSLSNIQMIRRRDFPNIIPSSPEPSIGASYWATTKKTVSEIDDLPFITLEEFYKNSSNYYLSNRLLFIVRNRNGTFDIWRSVMLGQE